MSVTFTKEAFDSNITADKLDANGRVITDANDKPIREIIGQVTSKYLVDKNGDGESVERELIMLDQTDNSSFNNIRKVV